MAVLHGLNDWSVSSFNSYWPGILIRAVSLLLFLGYTMSASSRSPVISMINMNENQVDPVPVRDTCS